MQGWSYSKLGLRILWNRCVNCWRIIGMRSVSAGLHVDWHTAVAEQQLFSIYSLIQPRRWDQRSFVDFINNHFVFWMLKKKRKEKSDSLRCPSVTYQNIKINLKNECSMQRAPIPSLEMPFGTRDDEQLRDREFEWTQHTFQHKTLSSTTSGLTRHPWHYEVLFPASSCINGNCICTTNQQTGWFL